MQLVHCRCIVALVAVALSSTPTHALADPDVVEPPPERVWQTSLRVPTHARDYHQFESGIVHTLVQVRFELPARDIEALARELPCTLGPVATGPAIGVSVGTNDRPWFTPERAVRHRSCDSHSGIRDTHVLVDVSDAARAVTYIVIAVE